MPYSVSIQTNFGSAQTNVKWQLYDAAGLLGSASAVGVTSPITGIYTAIVDVTAGIGLQWTCNNPALTRQVDLGPYQYGDLLNVLSNISLSIAQISNTIDKLEFMLEADPGNPGQWRWTYAALSAAIEDLESTLDPTWFADVLLTRDWTAISEPETARCALNALRMLRNKFSIAGTTMTVTKEDDLTAAWTSALTTNPAANPITGSDPA